MGQGRGAKALAYTKLITLYTTGCLLIISLLLILFSEQTALIFTSDPELVLTVSTHYKYMALFLVIHGAGQVFGGALKGMGK